MLITINYHEHKNDHYEIFDYDEMPDIIDEIGGELNIFNPGPIDVTISDELASIARQFNCSFHYTFDGSTYYDDENHDLAGAWQPYFVIEFASIEDQTAAMAILSN